MTCKKLLITTVAMIGFPSISFAFFCPTNFSQIDYGMTVDQVTQICGKPTSQKEYTKPNENVPQEWSYYIPQTVNMGGTSQNAQGTLKTSVTFDDKGKAINISVNGIGVGATSICGSNMKLGDDRDSIKSACGAPAFVNKQSVDPETAKKTETKIVELNYSSVTPPVLLIFENGKLTEKK